MTQIYLKTGVRSVHVRPPATGRTWGNDEGAQQRSGELAKSAAGVGFESPQKRRRPSAIGDSAGAGDGSSFVLARRSCRDVTLRNSTRTKRDFRRHACNLSYTGWRSQVTLLHLTTLPVDSNGAADFLLLIRRHLLGLLRCLRESASARRMSYERSTSSHWGLRVVKSLVKS